MMANTMAQVSATMKSSGAPTFSSGAWAGKGHLRDSHIPVGGQAGAATPAPQRCASSRSRSTAARVASSRARPASTSAVCSPSAGTAAELGQGYGARAMGTP